MQRRLAGPLLVALVALLAGACSSSPSKTRSVAPTTSPATAAPTTSPEDAAASAQFGFGQEVMISDTDVQPRQLVAQVDQDVVFRNASAREISIEFLNYDIEPGQRGSGPIPPGGTFAISPKLPVSIAYQLAGRPELRGAIQMDRGVKTI